MRSAVPLALIGVVVVLATGCGGDGGQNAEPAQPLVPPAKTQQEWARRLTTRFLNPVENDLRIINLLSSPTTLLYLYEGNSETLSTVKQRMNDLQFCSYKLARVGAPPSGAPKLATITTSFRQACVQYERLAGLVLQAVPLLASEDPAKKKRGRTVFSQAAEPSRLAAKHYGRAVHAIERDRTLRHLILGG